MGTLVRLGGKTPPDRHMSGENMIERRNMPKLIWGEEGAV